MTTKLAAQNLDALSASTATPSYDRSALSAGIVHFGVGNFHRAHQAVYLDSLFNSGHDHGGPSSVPACCHQMKRCAGSSRVRIF